jgi:hypothetical protein
VNGERVAGIAAFAVVVAGVAIGFAAIGPPQHVRLIELDHRRVSDLQTIERSIHYAESRRAPDRITAPPRSRAGWPRDPATGRPYEYHRESDTRYRVCAVFALPSDADSTTYGTAGWRHGAGRTCYRLDTTGVDQEFPEVTTTTVTTVTR